MDLYIPDESFIEQYPEWGAWDWSEYKNLPSDPAIKTEGALLFVEGKVDQLSPSDDGLRFESRVTDEAKAYATSTWLIDSTSQPKFECGCPAGRAATPCVHAMALLATLIYLFHEHNFIPLSPILNKVNALAASIDHSKPQAQRPFKRIRIRIANQSAAYLEGDSELPDPFVQMINPYRSLSRIARNTLELPKHDLRNVFRNLTDYVRDHRMKFEAESPGGGFIKVQPNLTTFGTALRFIGDPEPQRIRLETTNQGVEPDDILADLGDNVLILQSGKIAVQNDDKFTPLVDGIESMEVGFSDFGAELDAFIQDDFNYYVTRLNHANRRLYRQCEFGQIKNGSFVPEFPEAAKPKKIRATLHIDQPEQSTGNQLAYLRGEIGDECIELSGIFGDFMRLLCQLAKDGDRLLGSRARATAILDAASQLPRLAKQADRRALIETTAHRHEFRSEAQTKATVKFLRNLERDYCRPKSADTPMFLQNPRTREAAWHKIRLPLHGLLCLTATLYRNSDFQKLIGSELLPLPINLNDEVFHDIAEICEHFDITLLIDDETTLIRRAAIRIDIDPDTNEDWFELKPSIQCQGVEIPPEQWLELIGGNLRLENPEGGLISPRAENTSALARLLEAFPARTRASAESSKVHRLHLLDWIALRKEGLELHLPPDIETLFRELLDFKGIPELPATAGLRAEMRPYQRSGYEWLVFLHRHRLGACLADDMGLGKTLQSLAFLSHLQSESSDTPLRALAVLPSSLLYNWETEAARFTPGLKVATYAGSDRGPSAFDCDLCLTTYDIVRRDIERLEQLPFSVVLFDEAQALKNDKSHRSQAARRLNRRFTLCLTGTPLENHLGEFHSIMDIALPGLMGTRKQFDQAIKDGDGSLLRRARPFMLRRTKDAILTELPPKVESDIYLEMDENQREIYTRIIGELREEVLSAYQKQSRSQAGICALAALTRLRQLCISPALLGHKIPHHAPKIQYLADTLTEIIAEGQSVLVFSQFVKSLDLIEAPLRNVDIEPLRLDGSSSQKARRSAIDTFQNSDKSQIFLISLKAGGVGLNLTRASHVIHVDPWWNPSVENQASDRAHRIGQQQTVFIQRLLMRDSIEEKIMTLKSRKQALFNTIVNDQATGPKGTPTLTKADFDFLLQ